MDHFHIALFSMKKWTHCALQITHFLAATINKADYSTTFSAC